MATEIVEQGRGVSTAPSSVRPRMVRAGRALLSSQSARAALILTGLLLVFLWTPLTQNGYYAAADLMQPWPLTNSTPPGYRPENGLIGDTVFEMLPALYLNREELRAGHLPVWNPYNAYGAPHLASYQSAVLSPFSLPFYLLSFRAALIVAVFLKLFSLGYFTYLFLRQVRVHHFAALVGGVAFMFSGYQLVWLNWAHVGGAVALPGGLYFAELAFQSSGRQQLARRALALIGFALVLAAGLLAGHPETFFFSVLVVGPYLLFRLLHREFDWAMRLKHVLGFGLASVAALALVAPQLLAFLEYVPRSTLLALRAQQQSRGQLGIIFAPLTMFPDLLGNPSMRYEDPAIYGGGNYNELTGNYIGLIVLFLAGLAVITWLWHRSALVAFFAGVVGVWVVYAYNVLGIGMWMQTVPGLAYGVVNRSHDIWLFGLSCLAALGVHHVADTWGGPPRLWRRGDPHLLLVGLAALWSLGLLVIAYVGAFAFLGWATRQPNNMVGAPGARRVAFLHLLFIGLTYVLAAAGIVSFAAWRGRQHESRPFALLGGLLIALTFLQSGFMHRDLNPTIDSRLFYPVTPALAEIERQTGGALTLRADDSGIPANANLMYGLSSVANYDGMGVKSQGDLLVKLLRVREPHQVDWTAEQTARPIGLQALQTMGIQYVVTPLRYPFIYRARPFVSPKPQDIRVASLVSDRPVSQMFKVEESNLSFIKLAVSTYGRSNSCTLLLNLADTATGQALAQSSASCRNVQADNTVTFGFPAQPDSKTRQYRLTISSPDASADNALGVLYIASTEGQAGSPSERLVIDPYTSDVPGLQEVWTDGRLKLFRVPGSVQPYYAVGRAVVVGGDAEAFALLAQPTFDAAGTVILDANQMGANPAVGQADTPPGTVQVLQQTPTRIHLRVERGMPGWLVGLQTYYPGWKATVNGQSGRLLRANTAFSAVPIGAGVNDVILEYDPQSVKIGVLLSALAALSLIVLGVLCVRRLWPRRSGDAPLAPKVQGLVEE